MRATTVDRTRPYAVLLFFLLAYVLSWLEPLLPFDHPVFAVLSVAGPTVAAVLTVVALEGRDRLDALFASVLQWRAAPFWYGVTILLHPLLALSAVLLLGAFGAGTANVVNEIPWAAVPAIFVGRLLINVWEEVGWRGYALPRLQARYAALTASVIIGVFWGLWHLPQYLLAEGILAELPAWLFFGEFVVVSIIYTWLYNGTDGSLLFVTLFHVLGNTTALLIIGAGLPFTTYLLFRLPLLTLIAIAVIVVYGPHRLSRKEPVAVEVQPL